MRLPQPGEVVGPYRCLKLLASGGMGAVFEAEHETLGRRVALKVLLAPHDAELVARFEREAEACGRLQHPNLVQVHDSGVQGGLYYLAMELIQGESLQALLEREGPLPQALACARIQEAARGIAAAHAQGVLHRDLKPANLLWDQVQERVRVVDFGLTGRLRKADSLTVTGEVLGTPGFLSPEQATGESRDAGPAIDVYGLGATLYALLSGGPPFRGRGLAGLAEVATDPAPDLATLRPPQVAAKVEPWLSQLVASCLAKDPADRPASAEAFATRVSAGRASAPRRPWLVAALSLAALIALVLGLVAWNVQARRARLWSDYAAWRAEVLEPFRYGWGQANPELADEVAAWRELLPPATDEASRRAQGELWAAARILGSVSGTPPDGPEAHLAQAFVELEVGRLEQAQDELDAVRGPLRESEPYRRTRVEVQAREPAGLRRLLSDPEPGELALLSAAFPGALRRIAPRLPASALTDLAALAEDLKLPGWGAALVEALEVSAELRERELAQSPDPVRDLGLLCKPLRRCGLWPGPAFVAAVRRDFARASREQGERSLGEVLSLVRYEHEIFYRADPQLSAVESFVGALQSVPAKRSAKHDPLLNRSLLRYGITSFANAMAGGPESPLSRALEQTPEPGSLLERAWALELSVANRVRSLEDLRRLQPRLEETLSGEGVDDLPPEVADALLTHFTDAWRDAREATPELAAEAERIGWAEFRRCLSWAKSLRLARLAKGISAAIELAALPRFRLGQPERGVALFAAAIEELERAQVGVGSPLVSERLWRAAGELCALLGSASWPTRSQALAIPVLEPRLELTERCTGWVRDTAWATILAGLREQDPARARRLRARVAARVGPNCAWLLTVSLARSEDLPQAMERVRSALAYWGGHEGEEAELACDRLGALLAELEAR